MYGWIFSDLEGIQGYTFSRSQITSCIILPEKALTRTSRAAANDDIINYHRQTGTFPRPFAPAPPSFSLTPPRSSILNPNSKRSSFGLSAPFPTFARHSFASSERSLSRFSVSSAASSSASSLQATGHFRKVRQLFNPVLPDELLLTRVGERLTVVQSFDDGWCVVGRDGAVPKAASGPKSLFKSSTDSAAGDADPNVELGMVPAWCFLKPVKGLRAERPVRSTSLGITVQMDGPGFASREEVISWSNF